jgi:hypothetical protein
MASQHAAQHLKLPIAAVPNSGLEAMLKVEMQNHNSR